MVKNQTKKLTAILTNEDLQKYLGEGFWNLIQAVVEEDDFSKIAAGKNIKELVFHMPTVLFWDKMKRFLMGTFHDYQEQVKMAQKFNEDNKNYEDFVKRQIHLINNLDDDMKIDYFAALTRCLLITDLNEQLYFKLCKFLSICTLEELIFLKNCPNEFKGKNSAIISSLFQYGLFTQEEENGEILYILSDFARALKQNSLNYDVGLNGTQRITTYEQVTPLNLAKPGNGMVWENY